MGIHASDVDLLVELAPTRTLLDLIRWRQIAGLRDLLTHEHFHATAESDAIVERDLPPLDRAVREMLGRTRSD